MEKGRSTKRIIVIIAIAVAAVVLLVGAYLWFAASSLLGRDYDPELVIAISPDDQYELVVREFSCLGGSGAEIYIREPGQDQWYNSWKAKHIGNASGDNYYKPFADGAYYVEWESNQVTIYYYRSVPVENKDDPATWRGVVTYDLN